MSKMDENIFAALVAIPFQPDPTWRGQDVRDEHRVAYIAGIRFAALTCGNTGTGPGNALKELAEVLWDSTFEQARGFQREQLQRLKERFNNKEAEIRGSYASGKME